MSWTKARAGRVDPQDLGKSLQPSYDARSTQSMLQDQTLSGQAEALPDSSDVHSSFALLLRARNGDEDASNELCAR